MRGLPSLLSIAIQLCAASVVASAHSPPATAHCAVDPYRDIQHHAYGHLELTGAVEGIEFFRASFGETLKCGKHALSLASDAGATGCEASSFANVTGKAVVVHRGVCSFYDKAKAAANAGAAALIVVNSEQGLLRMPLPNASAYVAIQAVMIPNASWPLLRTLFNRKWHSSLEVAFRPFHDECDPASTVAGGGKSSPPDSAAAAAAFTEGGTLAIANGSSVAVPSAEFLAAYFSAPVPAGDFPVVWADPLFACTELRNAPGSLARTFVLVLRGHCGMVEKARRIEAAGGWGVIIVNSNHTIVGAGRVLPLPLHPNSQFQRSGGHWLDYAAHLPLNTSSVEEARMLAESARDAISITAATTATTMHAVPAPEPSSSADSHHGLHTPAAAQRDHDLHAPMTAAGRLHASIRRVAIVQAVGDDANRLNPVTIPCVMVSSDSAARMLMKPTMTMLSPQIDANASIATSTTTTQQSLQSEGASTATSMRVSIAPTHLRGSAWESVIKFAENTLTDMLSPSSSTSAMPPRRGRPTARTRPTHSNSHTNASNDEAASSGPGSRSDETHETRSPPVLTTTQLSRMLIEHHPLSAIGGEDRYELLRVSLEARGIDAVQLREALQRINWTHAGTVDPVTLSSMMSQLDFSGLLLVQQTTLLSATSTAAAGRGEPLFLLRRTEKAHLAFKNHRTGELDVWSAVQRRLADAKATAAAAATAAATADARDADSSSANLGVSFDHSIGDTSDLAHQSILERDNAHKREKDAAPLQRIPATADDGQQSASMYQQRGPFDDDSESTALLCRTPASGSVYTARILEMNSGVSSGMLPTLLAELLAQQACLEKLSLHNAVLIGRYAKTMQRDILHAPTSTAARTIGTGSWRSAAISLLKPWGYNGADEAEEVMAAYLRVADYFDES